MPGIQKLNKSNTTNIVIISQLLQMTIKTIRNQNKGWDLLKGPYQEFKNSTITNSPNQE